jgi:hypothetical protein
MLRNAGDLDNSEEQQPSPLSPLFSRDTIVLRRKSDWRAPAVKFGKSFSRALDGMRFFGNIH